MKLIKKVWAATNKPSVIVVGAFLVAVAIGLRNDPMGLLGLVIAVVLILLMAICVTATENHWCIECCPRSSEFNCKTCTDESCPAD